MLGLFNDKVRLLAKLGRVDRAPGSGTHRLQADRRCVRMAGTRWPPQRSKRPKRPGAAGTKGSKALGGCWPVLHRLGRMLSGLPIPRLPAARLQNTAPR